MSARGARHAAAAGRAQAGAGAGADDAPLCTLHVRNCAGWSVLLSFPADDLHTHEQVVLAAPLIARAAGAGAELELRAGADADAAVLARWCERAGWHDDAGRRP